MDDFRAIAQQIANDISEGRLQPGDRLPPQRVFAYNRGIAASTASRVYDELTRRGLVAGEVGRGTFVRSSPPSATPALAEPPVARFNLETNYPVLSDQQALLASVLQQVANNPEILHRSLREMPVRGTVAVRDSIARGMSGPEWRIDSNSLVFTGNGRQAISATFSSIATRGEQIGFDALTYPVAKAIAEKLGLVPVPLAMDADGIRPEAIEAAHRSGPLRAIYTQPTVHNPLGFTMSVERRREIADLFKKLNGPVIIEDSVYAFLDAAAPPPLAALAPERTIYLDSLSKRIGPGLTLGIISAPSAYIKSLTASVVSGAWGAQGFAVEVCSRWLADGTVDSLVSSKRRDAAERQALARKALAGLSVRANPTSYHVFIELPDGLRAATAVDAAAARGVAITAASAFAVSQAHAPNAIRLGLANLGKESIEPVLSVIVDIVRSGHEA